MKNIEESLIESKATILSQIKSSMINLNNADDFYVNVWQSNDFYPVWRIVKSRTGYMFFSRDNHKWDNMMRVITDSEMPNFLSSKDFAINGEDGLPTNDFKLACRRTNISTTGEYNGIVLSNPNKLSV